MRREAAKSRREVILPLAVVRFFEDGTLPQGGDLQIWRVVRRLDAVRPIWQATRSAFLARWIAAHPGTRPAAWWTLGDAPEPSRRRLGGVGTPRHAVLGFVPYFHLGLPVGWVTWDEISYYTGRAVDAAGRPIGREYAGRPFAGIPIDPADPPKFEAQASFLERHGLLDAYERARLPADAFEPEVITPGDDCEVSAC